MSHSSALAVDPQSDLQRKPTWAQISFDDGFDLNLDATSSLAPIYKNFDPLPSSPNRASGSNTVQPSQSFAEYGSDSTAPPPLASALASHTDAASASHEFKPLSLSPASSNKALPQLPSISDSAEHPQQPAATLPTSTSLSSTIHAPTPSSQHGTLTPKPPGTPQPYPHASPIVTAATPEQPQHPDPATTPIAGPAMHPPPRSQPSGVLAWDPPQPKPSRPVSSADAYMKPIEALQSETSSRPGTAMSQLSGSNWMHDEPGNRSSFGTTASAPKNQMKRASVLSFQTANSAGFTSADDARLSDRDDIANDTLVAHPTGALNLPPPHPNQFRPWLDQPCSGYGSSPDDRSFPGGLPGSFWDASSESQAARGVRDTASAAVDKAQSSLAPIDTHALAPASPNAPLSSTTIAAPSDETTQAMRRSPDVTREHQASLLLLDDHAPPLPAKDVRISVVGQAASPPPADNVIPPPLPSDAVDVQPPLAPDMLINGPADHKPVSDYRKKPLADISPAQKAAGLAHLHAQAKAARQANTDAQPNAPPTSPPAEAPPIPVLERDRRKSNASLTANVALAQAAAAPGLPRADREDRAETPSVESVSQESSAPPDGEVEARAEWERRRRLKRKIVRKQNEAAKPLKGRSDTFKNQLKPLQLVPADHLASFGDRNGMPTSAANIGARGNAIRHSIAVGDRAANTLAPASADSRQTYSTQQLQRLQAREQRRSVGAFSAAMAAANVASSGSNGPYPVFASPSSGPHKVGSRQYPGLMAQRSLVPPFELQHRPDGLPSGLIGPDGVRKSLNDPEVCLECMMRDEDMIDIRVVGEGVWERESDKDFEEAVRLEAEEAANANGSHGPSGSSGHGDSISSHRDSRVSRKPRKRIGKGELLTVERLKLHTQMNPPASSFRWRTLQTFLAVQAKYIAMEQQRIRLDAENKPTPTTDSISSICSIVALDSPAQHAERGLSSAFAPTREASAASRQSMLQSVEDSGLTPQQKADKERDVAAAQAARKKLTAAAAPAYATTPLQTRTPAQAVHGRSATDPEELLIGTAAVGGLMTPTSTRRMPFGGAQTARAASTQDLRSVADASRSASVGYPPSPSDSLMPPSRSFMGASPTGTPSRLAARSGASQLSLMHSGSMIDMHVAQEDRAEHRISQTGFLPGTPLGIESPAALHRSYYGFPGDGDSSLPDAAAFERSRVASGDGYVDPMEAGPRGLDLDRDDSTKRKKKGFRALLSKLTGSNGGPSRENSAGANAGGSINGSIASRNASKRSQGSGSSRPRQNSMSADRSLDAIGPALNSMLSKAHRSTSSFFRIGIETEAESKVRVQASANNSIFQNPPGMASQNSLDLGPFQPASPQANVFGSANGRVVQQQQQPQQQQQQQQGNAASDAAKMRKASNPLMHKHLNSALCQTQPSPVLNANAMSQPGGGTNGERLPVHPSQMSGDVRNSRMSSFASMRELRPLALQTIPDGEQRGDETDVRYSVRSSVGAASLRKELPFMPSSSGPGHERTASGATGGVRSSTLESNGSATQSPRLTPAFAMPRVEAGHLGGRGSMPTSPTSIHGAGVRRPPRNPRRPDGALNSPGGVDLNATSDGVNAPRHDFPPQTLQAPNTYGNGNGNGISWPDSPDKKKSMFRLPFGRKKRESTMGTAPNPSIVVAATDTTNVPPPPPPPTTTSLLPKLRSRKSYAGLGVPKPSFQTERQRVLSSPAFDSSDMPSRSHSALGMASTHRFVSMDLPRRSTNVSRTNNSRLSTVGVGYEYDDDDDDEMEREPGYEAEFNRYAQEALEERCLATTSKARDVSFGRKSLNLLRDGLRLPLRQQPTAGDHTQR